MMSASPYEAGYGDRLVLSDDYPEDVQNYLREEGVFLKKLLPFSHLVEVGCVHGRYMDWCQTNGSGYIGIDKVERYIEMGRARISSGKYNAQQFKLAQMDACNIHHLNLDNQAVILFPFSSFGIMQNPSQIANRVTNANCSFVVSTYKTDDRSNEARRAYYEKAGFEDLEIHEEDAGVRFVSRSKGLDSIAYRPAHIKAMFPKLQGALREASLGKIGIAYYYKSPAL